MTNTAITEKNPANQIVFTSQISKFMPKEIANTKGNPSNMVKKRSNLALLSST